GEFAEEVGPAHQGAGRGVGQADQPRDGQPQRFGVWQLRRRSRSGGPEMGACQQLRPPDRKLTVIGFHDVHKVYDDGTVAIDRLNLEVPPGTLTVFVGPSGCGKTTSMRMINRMAEPTSGTVVVDGAAIARVDPG